MLENYSMNINTGINLHNITFLYDKIFIFFWILVLKFLTKMEFLILILLFLIGEII